MVYNSIAREFCSFFKKICTNKVEMSKKYNQNCLKKGEFEQFFNVKTKETV